VTNNRRHYTITEEILRAQGDAGLNRRLDPSFRALRERLHAGEIN
jgi:predicted dehydrogenase